MQAPPGTTPPSAEAVADAEPDRLEKMSISPDLVAGIPIDVMSGTGPVALRSVRVTSTAPCCHVASQARRVAHELGAARDLMPPRERVAARA